MKPAAFVTLLAAAALLTACGGGGGWWPWKRSDGELPRTPPGATRYACEGGRTLWVRYAPDKTFAWVIFPEREFRLERAQVGSGERFSNGRTVLNIAADQASLEEAGAPLFANCRLQSQP